MRIAMMTLIAALTGVAAQAREDAGATVEHQLTVCMEGNATLVVTVQAQSLATRIFAVIGVTVDWRTRFRGCPSDGILISLSDHTPPTLEPGALAYAFPYEGTHIRVFYDRIASNYRPSLIPIVTGHVLAHEIAHILQGITRHSDHGIMKAKWNAKDCDDMAWRPLEFERHDVKLIYIGLAARARRQVAAVDTSRAAATQK